MCKDGNLDQESFESIQSSVIFWKSVCCDTEYIESNMAETKAYSVEDGCPARSGDGYWALISTTLTVNDYDCSGHITTTAWGQRNGYNQYCPLKSDESGHAKAGCVAVSGAQMLYFLHYALGRPVTAPVSAKCNVKIGCGMPSISTTYSSTIWDDMDCENYSGSVSLSSRISNAAVLIAKVGVDVDMNYGNDQSGADDTKLVSVFSDAGISSTYSSFDANNVKNNLLTGMPVVARASSSESAHSFIIDGYARSQVAYVNTYGWVDNASEFGFDNGGTIPGADAARKVTITYSSPYITSFMMNWGWGSDRKDNTLYAPSGSWGNYNQGKKIICDFSINN